MGQLTVARVKTLTEPGRYTDGDGPIDAGGEAGLRTKLDASRAHWCRSTRCRPRLVEGTYVG